VGDGRRYKVDDRHLAAGATDPHHLADLLFGRSKWCTAKQHMTRSKEASRKPMRAASPSTKTTLRWPAECACLRPVRQLPLAQATAGKGVRPLA